jgi:hypothetical protein
VENLCISTYTNLGLGPGRTRIQNQRNIFDKQFPDPSSATFFTTEEKKQLRDEYQSYKDGLSPKDQKLVIDTYTTVNQVCALQYRPRTQDTTTECLCGTYAYFNAKKQVEGPGTHDKPTERLLGYKITVTWVKFVSKTEYVSLVMEEAKKWHHIVVGNSREHADMAPKRTRTKIPVAYPQCDDEKKCLFLCLASGLHYMGFTEEAAKLAALENEFLYLPGTRGIEALRAAMIDCAHSIGRPQVFNSPKKK